MNRPVLEFRLMYPLLVETWVRERTEPRREPLPVFFATSITPSLALSRHGAATFMPAAVAPM